MIARVGEAAATTAVGAALAGVTWSIFGLGWPAAIVGGLNGLIGGWRRTYGWRSGRGVVAVLLDSTWAAPMTVSALVAHGVAVFTPARGGYVRALSERQDRHVYAGGLQLRRGFVIALGNTVNNVGRDVAASPRRQQLVRDHEDLHIWQARWFGPLYPVIYVGWMVLMGPVGAVVWLVSSATPGAVVQGDRDVRLLHEPVRMVGVQPRGQLATGRDGRELGWRRPMVRPVNRAPAAPPAAPG